MKIHLSTREAFLTALLALPFEVQIIYHQPPTVSRVAEGAEGEDPKY